MCRRCESFAVDCIWADGQISTSGGTARAGACASCRNAKIRCTRERPTCAQCARRAIDCTYTSAPRVLPGEWQGTSVSLDEHSTVGLEPPSTKRIRFHPPLSSARHADESTVAKANVEDLVNLYYTYIYPLNGNGFIHRGQLSRDLQDETVPPILLKSICALAFRYSSESNNDNPDGGERAAKWAQEVKDSLMANTDQYSTAKMTATLNLIIHEQNSGRHGSAWLLVSLATRMALAMGLYLDHEAFSWVEQETRRRLTWAAFILEAQVAGGHQEYLGLSAGTIRGTLPCSEMNYTRCLPSRGWPAKTILEGPLRSGNGSLQPDDRSDGYFTRHIWLMTIRMDLLQWVHVYTSAEVSYTKNMIDYPGKPWESTSCFTSLVNRLKDFAHTLAPEFGFTAENLYALRPCPGELSSLVTIHLWLDLLHSSLYRLALPGFDETAPPECLEGAPPGWIEKLRTGADLRAGAMVDKLRLLLRHCPDFVLSTYKVGAMVYECTRTLLAHRALYPAPEAETLDSLEVLLECLGRNTKYFYSSRRIVSHF